MASDRTPEDRNAAERDGKNRPFEQDMLEDDARPGVR